DEARRPIRPPRPEEPGPPVRTNREQTHDERPSAQVWQGNRRAGRSEIDDERSLERTTRLPANAGRCKRAHLPPRTPFFRWSTRGAPAPPRPPKGRRRPPNPRSRRFGRFGEGPRWGRDGHAVSARCDRRYRPGMPPGLPLRPRLAEHVL